MTSFMQKSARHFVAIKAARELGKEIEKAGIDNLKALADAGKSIVSIYLNACSEQEKKRVRQDLGVLLRMGVTPDMVLTELAGQNPEIGSIMETEQDYKKKELQNLEQFLKEH